jgi:hypothetical protein
VWPATHTSTTHLQHCPTHFPSLPCEPILRTGGLLGNWAAFPQVTCDSAWQCPKCLHSTSCKDQWSWARHCMWAQRPAPPRTRWREVTRTGRPSSWLCKCKQQGTWVEWAEFLIPGFLKPIKKGEPEWAVAQAAPTTCPLLPPHPAHHTCFVAC